ncbi:MAG: TonB-dependent receptor [Acidobacteria bacterium]|nr:TonB-dependent receptor [Acidobacteriota bacterium]
MFRWTLSIALFSAALYSQSFQGGIRGLVTDAGGGAVPGAKVSLIDQGTNSTRATLTNEAGEYVFNGVVPATYHVTAESPSFKKFERKDIVLGTQQFLTIDIKLEVGQVTESVLVTEEVPVIETANASAGQLIDRQKLIDLPNLGRNPFMMAKVAQNVVAVGNPRFNRMQDQSGSSQISLAGGPVRGNNYLLDGIPITDSVNRAVIIPTLEAVQEVKVQANTYDAEMGRTGGGMFNTFLKSGTNEFHGSGFGYMRQTEWLANNFFNNRAGRGVPNQPFRNYGAAIGGPIWIPKVYNGKDKTFFWISGEAYRQTSSTSTELSVPTAIEKTGDFSRSFLSGTSGAVQTIYDPLTTQSGGARTPFAGNVIPSNRLSPIGLAIARHYSAPTKERTGYGANNYSAASSQYDRADQFSAKADHQVTKWWRASASYLHYGSREPGEWWMGTTASTAGWLLARKVDATAVSSIFTPSPTTVVTLRYGFNRFPNLNTTRSSGFDVTTLGFSPAYASKIQATTFPLISMQNFSGLGVTNNNAQVFHSKNLMGSVAKFMGRHSYKMGVDYRRLHIDGIEYGDPAGSFTFSDGFTRETPLRATSGSGSDLASLLLGFPSAGSFLQATKMFQYLDYYGFYFHDDFRVNAKLTINFGLRYEYETGLKATGNTLITGFDRTVKSPIAVTTPIGGFTPVGGLLYAGKDGGRTQTGNLNKNKFAPRAGFAYQLNSKTTIRGGYGMFWAPIAYGFQNTLGYSQTTSYLSSVDGGFTPAASLANPFPNGVLTPVGNANGLLSGIGQSVSFIDQNHRAPNIHQFSFDVQRQLPWGLALAAGYVGSRSYDLVLGAGGLNINQLDPKYFAEGSAALNAPVTNPYYLSTGPGFISGRTMTREQFLRPFNQFSNVTLSNSDYNRGVYDSLVSKVQKRMSNGLSLLASWTWSRNMDASIGGPGSFFNGLGAVQNVYNLDAEYSLSSVHSPHRFSSAFTYELPFGKGKKWIGNNYVADLLAGGWSVNGIVTYQTGYPLAITQSSNNNSSFGGGGQRPNATGVSPVTDGGLMDRIDGYINRAAFTEVPKYQFGNLSRTIGMRGPGISEWNTSLFKTFSITEKFKAQFRAEALNAFNTPQFRAPNLAFGVSNSNFGKITEQANFSRMIQLGVRFFF